MTVQINGDNTIAAPGFSGPDADTGLQTATNELSLVTGGSARLFIDSSGRVGVGTSSPQDLLHVEAGNGGGITISRNSIADNEYSDQDFVYRSGSTYYWTSKIRALKTSGGGGDLQFFASSNGSEPSTPAVVVNKQGRLGVGTTSPSVALHAYHATNNTLLRAESGDATARINIVDSAGQVFVSAKGDDLTFDTSSAATERMRIDSSGRVGIGTSSPSADYFSTAQLVHISGANNAAIKFERTSATARKWEIGCATGGSFDIADTVFSTSTPRLRIDTSGNVGIGASSPGAQLDVRGSSTGDAKIRLDENGSFQAALQLRGNDLEIRGSSGTIEFYGGNANESSSSEIARFDGSGRLLLGTTTVGNSNADELTLANSSGAAGVTIRAAANYNSNVYFADPGSSTIGRIEYRHNGDTMRFYTFGSEVMRNTSTGELQFNSGFGSVATAYGVRAWAHFDGSASSIGSGDESGNISSITDNGTGNYYLNFSNNMPDVNYAVCGTCSGDTSNDLHEYSGHVGTVHNGFSSSGCQIVVTRNMSGAESDLEWDSVQVSVAIIR